MLTFLNIQFSLKVSEFWVYIVSTDITFLLGKYRFAFLYGLLFNYIAIIHFTYGDAEDSTMSPLAQRNFPFPPDIQYVLSYDGLHILIYFLYGKWLW